MKPTVRDPGRWEGDIKAEGRKGDTRPITALRTLAQSANPDPTQTLHQQGWATSPAVNDNDVAEGIQD